MCCASFRFLCKLELTLVGLRRRYKRPVALVGILVVSAAWEWLQKHQAGGAGGGTAVAPGAVGPPGRRGRRGGAPNGAAPAVLPPKSKLHQLKQLAVTICASSSSGRASRRLALTRARCAAVTWAVLMFSQVVPALGLAALATIAGAYERIFSSGCSDALCDSCVPARGASQPGAADPRAPHLALERDTLSKRPASNDARINLVYVALSVHYRRPFSEP